MVQNSEDKKGYLHEHFLKCVLLELEKSTVQKKKCRIPKLQQALRLDGLAALLKIFPSHFEINEKVLFDYVIHTAARSQGDVQVICSKSFPSESKIIIYFIDFLNRGSSSVNSSPERWFTTSSSLQITLNGDSR